MFNNDYSRLAEVIGNSIGIERATTEDNTNKFFKEQGIQTVITLLIQELEDNNSKYDYRFDSVKFKLEVEAVAKKREKILTDILNS